jgi:Holliday junction resolvase
LGFAVIRAPASGSRTHLDRPDIVAGGKGLYLAFEVKSTIKESLYIQYESLMQLTRFAEKFGAKPLIAVKFKVRGKGWILLEPENLSQTKKGYKVTLREAFRTGKSLEALVTRKLGEYAKEA